MYIQPNTVIKLCSDVPLENTYEHTIYFEDAAAQQAYFSSKAKRNFTAQTFQRTDRLTCRLQVPIGDVYDCNYMMFQNSSFSNKWFYAFITKVGYVNNEVTEITYEIDEWQTWLFDYTLQECYIERQHTETDEIGQNIVPEPVALGEYVFNKQTETDKYKALQFTNLTNGTDYSELAVMIAIIDIRETTSAGRFYDGVYGGAKLWAFRTSDLSGINDKISEYIQSPDSIISIYMLPIAAIRQSIPETSGGAVIANNARGEQGIYEGTALTGTERLDGYLPKNKKLYTYPYNYFHVDNSNRASLSLRYEFFKDLTPFLKSANTITLPVKVALWPARYKNVSEDQAYTEFATPLLTESIELSDFPMCSWNVDTYKAWVAQNSVPLALNSVASLGQTAISATYSTNPGASLASGAIGTAANVLSQAYSASIAADMCKGSFNNGGVNCAIRKQTFFGGRVSITGDMAKRIDDFFEFFGYQINEAAVPNLIARPHWTYIKLGTCVTTGSVPNDSMSKITEIYKAGITVWRNGSEVGNYSLDNRPTA